MHRRLRCDCSIYEIWTLFLTVIQNLNRARLDFHSHGEHMRNCLHNLEAYGNIKNGSIVCDGKFCCCWLVIVSAYVGFSTVKRLCYVQGDPLEWDSRKRQGIQNWFKEVSTVTTVFFFLLKYKITITSSFLRYIYYIYKSFKYFWSQNID